MAVGKTMKQLTGLGCKRVFAAIARSVTPPDLAWVRCICQCMKHGEDRSSSDTGAQQDDRIFACLEREVASGSARLKRVAGVETVMKEAAPDTVGTLYADAIPPHTLGARHGIAAIDGRLQVEFEGQVLAGKLCRQRGPIF